LISNKLHNEESLVYENTVDFSLRVSYENYFLPIMIPQNDQTLIVWKKFSILHDKIKDWS